MFKTLAEALYFQKAIFSITEPHGKKRHKQVIGFTTLLAHRRMLHSKSSNPPTASIWLSDPM